MNMKEALDIKTYACLLLYREKGKEKQEIATFTHEMKFYYTYVGIQHVHSSK